MKKYYPLCLDIENKKCIVIGAGNVAYQKIQKLLNYKADVLVIAQEIKSEKIKNLAKTKKIKTQKQSYKKDILKDIFHDTVLIIAATNNKDINSKIQKDALKKRILVNVVDDKKLCQFICPAIAEINDIQFAISTHGQNPKKAAQMRKILEKKHDLLHSLRLGTRNSTLALAQVSEFLNQFNKTKSKIKFHIETFQNQGDIDKTSLIEKVSFTNKIQQALINNNIDVAIHSAKDLDDEISEKLEIIALSPTVDPDEALVAKNNWTLKTLPKNARIGASGVRRRAQLKKFRPDLKLIRIRGNIDERLKLIKTKKLDGIIVANAAMIRLGLGYLVTEVISTKIMPAHPLQGKLAVQIRRDDEETKKLLAPILKKISYKLY